MLFIVICIYLGNPLHAIAWTCARFDHPTHLQNNFPLALPAVLLNRFGQLAAISSCCVLALSLPAKHVRGGVKKRKSMEIYLNINKYTYISIHKSSKLIINPHNLEYQSPEYIWTCLGPFGPFWTLKKMFNTMCDHVSTENAHGF